MINQDRQYLAFDLGASSGRAILGRVRNGRLELEEIHRFKNYPYEKDGHYFWDFRALLGELETGLKKAAKAAPGLVSFSVDTWGVDYALFRNGELIPTNDPGWVDPNIENINATLKGFRIDGEVVDSVSGPTFTRYSINLAPGVSGSRITSIQNDLQRTLQATSLRIQNPIPGKAYIGLEVPNKKRRKVCIRELIDRPEFLNSPDPLYIPIGLDVEGKAKYVSISDFPHGLIAGSSGSGKSVFLGCMLVALLYKDKPDDVRFFFIDPKQVDLQQFKDPWQDRGCTVCHAKAVPSHHRI